MDKSLIAKLHDILKLGDDSKAHYCPEWCDNFSSLNEDIKKALKHHCVRWYWTKDHKRGCNPFPITREMMCVHLADIKASTISRKLRSSKECRSYKTFRVWKDCKKNEEAFEQEKFELLKAPAALISDICTSSSLDELYEKFRSDFSARAEDARRCPFASLNTHNELTEIWYRFFAENSTYFEIPNEMADLNRYRQILFSFLRKKVSFVRIKLTSHGKLSRLRDTKLIQDIPQILGEMSDELGGTIVYRLPEEILMVTIPTDANEIARKAEKVLGVRTNYYFEVTVSSTILSNKNFLHKYNELFGSYEKNLYPELPTEIRVVPDNEASHRALICDLCQMAPAVKIYPREIYPDSTMIEPVEEFLCEGCLRLREEASRADKLAKWEDEEDTKVAFFKINLHMGELVDFLKQMFTDELGFQRLLDEDLGFSILKEFLEDYEKFVHLFGETVMSRADYGAEHNHEWILKNLFCIKIRKENEIKPLVREYVEMFRSDKFFSQFVYFAEKKKQSLPVKLSVTISSVKYPFMEHWYVLNNPRDSINLYAVPHTKLQTSFEKYSYLMDIRLEDSRISSALHRLSEIEARTKNQFLLMAAMVEMKNDLKDLAQHLITTKELSLKEALSYYKLMGN